MLILLVSSLHYIQVRELTQTADELRWRLIEKDREIERLSTATITHARSRESSRDSREEGRKRSRERGERGERERGSLKKSKSLDGEVDDLKRQLDASQSDVSSLR